MHPNTLHTQVVAPYDCEDARGLLKSAIRDPDPVIVLENEILYGETFPLSDAAMDKEFLIPLGKAKVRRGRSGTGSWRLQKPGCLAGAWDLLHWVAHAGPP